MNFCPSRFQGIPFFSCVLKGDSDAFARITGSSQYPGLHGLIRFYQTEYGVLTAAEITGLPKCPECCSGPVFAFHIHEGGQCQGSASDPFADTGGHYNPGACPHPYHAGDLPPLFGNHGYAFSVFLTDRFCAEEIIGHTVIIHSHPDDFMTQPSGNAGSKIACGVIRRT